MIDIERKKMVYYRKTCLQYGKSLNSNCGLMRTNCTSEYTGVGKYSTWKYVLTDGPFFKILTFTKLQFPLAGF